MARKRSAPKTVENFFKPIQALNEEQRDYIRSIRENKIVVCTGRPGSGKTAVACGMAAEYLYYGRVEKIVLTRPCIGSEDVGYLPGTGAEKIHPYLRPMLTELAEFIDIKDDRIEVLPLSEMRGTTLKNAFVICDESQNANARLLRMLLTRIGKDSKMLITGDIRQSDLKRKELNDFQSVINDVLKPLSDRGWPIDIINLLTSVRDPLVEAIDVQFDQAGYGV